MWAILLALAILPAPDPIVDRVDLVEVNHFYDERGKLVFNQLLFYDWRPFQSEYEVRAWRLLKGRDQRPERDHRSGEWVTIFHDGGIFREVRAAAIRETWTQHDPELTERDNLPKEKRRGLTLDPPWRRER